VPGGWAVYSDDHDRQLAERRAILGGLPRAIAADELVLYVQPKVALRSGRLAGVEALLRWEHPQLGLLGPDRFIALAEESGQIGAVTRWAIGAALRHCRGWLEAGLEAPIAVNLSALDTQDQHLPSMVAELLAQFQVPARLLSLEITEGALMRDPEVARQVLERLTALGLKIAVDDFGTGYSSLAYLRRFPVHELKIDRSLVSEIVHEPRDRAIVQSTIELGHTLDMTVVAEGVEDAATQDLLASLGCDLVQGYHTGRPLPATDLLAWAEADQHRPARAA
jgi:EAL domain-containing protein (putative c-di-GMP-specific phosphodiesterase class I)